MERLQIEPNLPKGLSVSQFSISGMLTQTFTRHVYSVTSGNDFADLFLSCNGIALLSPYSQSEAHQAGVQCPDAGYLQGVGFPHDALHSQLVCGILLDSARTTFGNGVRHENVCHFGSVQWPAHEDYLHDHGLERS